jgi:predicted RNA-binding protein with PIN domain
MPYLIDGHNVIGQTRGLSLADPDDEAKLAALVRRFCARHRRRAVLIFDGGLPGGVSSMSNADVTVVFASDRHTTADDLLLNRIRDERNPAGSTVVTSDQKVARAARRRRIPVLASAEFGRMLLKVGRAKAADEKEQGLGQAQVEEWEALFRKKKK